MTPLSGNGASARQPQHARDLQAKLYREIGISAVAAALRCTTLPEPPLKAVAKPADRPYMDRIIAA